jgi:hypothetical protein
MGQSGQGICLNFLTHDPYVRELVSGMDFDLTLEDTKYIHLFENLQTYAIEKCNILNEDCMIMREGFIPDFPILLIELKRFKQIFL